MQEAQRRRRCRQGVLFILPGMAQELYCDLVAHEIMTSFITSFLFGGASGGVLLAFAEISGDTYLPIKEAASIATGVTVFMLWLDRQFAKTRRLITRHQTTNDMRWQWTVASTRIINHKLHLETIPEPEENGTTSK